MNRHQNTVILNNKAETTHLLNSYFLLFYYGFRYICLLNRKYEICFILNMGYKYVWFLNLEATNCGIENLKL